MSTQPTSPTQSLESRLVAALAGHAAASPSDADLPAYLDSLLRENARLRQEAESAPVDDDLRERDIQFRQLADNLHAVLWISSEDFRRWIYISPAFEKIWGIKPDDLGRSLGTATVHPDDRPAFIESFAGALKGDGVGLEYRIVRPDGSVRWVSTRAFPIRDANDRAYRLGGISEDVTDRKDAERLLVESEERFRTLIENLPLGVYRASADGGIEMANPALLKMLGFDSLEELRAHELGHAGEPDRRLDPDRRADADKQANPDPPPSSSPVPLDSGSQIPNPKSQIQNPDASPDASTRPRWRRRDGSPLLVREFAVATRNADGAVDFHAGIVEDITEKKRVEEELSAAQLEKEQFYRFLVHDLNKPLAAIIGFSSALQSAKGLDADSETLVQKIRSASLRVRDIVGQFLEIERLRRGEIDVNLRDFDLWKHVCELIGMLEVAGPERRIMIEGEPLDPAREFAPIMIHSDPTCVSRIIQNLIDNALKYGKERIDIRINDSQAGAVLSVWNDGPCIPKEMQERIFAEFYRMPSRGAKGMGIGLASVKRLLQILGGSVWVRSRPTTGTTFFVRFPKSLASEPPVP